MHRFSLLALCGLLAGCWNTDASTVAAGAVDFAPEVGGPEGFLVEELVFKTPLECPDGEKARFYAVYNEQNEGPVPVAVIYHSGSFDYVLEPNQQDPLAGDHLQEESRLDAAWAIRRVFVLLGMYPDDDQFEQHEGLIPKALAENNVAMILPTNCWGDMWHNQAGVQENKLSDDGFITRNGRTAAIFGFRLASEPGFATTELVDPLPFEVAANSVYTIGLGEGGRAVSELLADKDGDGESDYLPDGALVDSVADDLRVYYDTAAPFQDTVTGLNRIFPGGSGDVREGSFGGAPELPDPFIYVYSSGDTRIPVGAHDAALRRMENVPNNQEAEEIEDVVNRHVILNASVPQQTTSLIRLLIGAEG